MNNIQSIPNLPDNNKSIDQNNQQLSDIDNRIQQLIESRFNELDHLINDLGALKIDVKEYSIEIQELKHDFKTHTLADKKLLEKQFQIIDMLISKNKGSKECTILEAKWKVEELIDDFIATKKLTLKNGLSLLNYAIRANDKERVSLILEQRPDQYEKILFMLKIKSLKISLSLKILN